MCRLTDSQFEKLKSFGVSSLARRGKRTRIEWDNEWNQLVRHYEEYLTRKEEDQGSQLFVLPRDKHMKKFYLRMRYFKGLAFVGIISDE